MTDHRAQDRDGWRQGGGVWVVRAERRFPDTGAARTFGTTIVIPPPAVEGERSEGR